MAPLVVVSVIACGGDESERETPAAAATSSSSIGAPIFVDVARQVGLEFRHDNGMSGQFYIPEVTAAGVGLVDFDDDGDLDVYLVQGGALGPDASREAAGGHRLYRNDLGAGAAGSGALRFVDVTAESGIDCTEYGMGVTAGDFDNDGMIDLYVTNMGPNRLYRNNGDGTFSDVTSAAGADDPRWSVPAVFLDYDADGWLDLFVGNYLDFTYDNHKRCMTVSGAPDYCGPSSYRGEPDLLLHNEGNGTFRDVTRDAGLHQAYGPALGAVAGDYDLDGRIDLYVANDGKANQMWLNQGDGTFADRALFAGTAVNAEGMAEASMGVESDDFDGDGDLDLFMAHITGETNTFYENDGTGGFVDASIRTGLGTPSKWATAFGAGSIDYDNDGWLDVVTVNGAVRTIEEQAREQIPYPLRQPNQLFRNIGGGRFREVSDEVGDAFRANEVSRGAAFGDVDNDGDTDVLILNSNGPVQLLLNQVGQNAHWLGLRLIGKEMGRDMLGARVELRREGGVSLWRTVRTARSFASANDPRILFGLGASPAFESVRVGWPDGTVEEFTGIEHDRYTTLRQGGGRPAS